jgi:hypothetical protein
LKTLRERYVKELKKKKTRSGDGATISCVPWGLMGHIEFLRDFVKHRRQVYVV